LSSGFPKSVPGQSCRYRTGIGWPCIGGGGEVAAGAEGCGCQEPVHVCRDDVCSGGEEVGWGDEKIDRF